MAHNAFHVVDKRRNKSSGSSSSHSESHSKTRRGKSNNKASSSATSASSSSTADPEVKVDFRSPPPGYSKQSGSKPSKPPTCFNCQQPGHRSPDCPRKKK